jgi:hypothetical protein
MTFIIDEDEALRKRLQGIVVYDQRAINDNAPRQVGVFFGQPDQEIRNQSYPYITIDMIDMQRDAQREMRGLVNPDYLRPSDIAAGEAFDVDIPIPVYLDYQITSYARQPRHDRAILAELTTKKLPMRFGALEIPTGLTDSVGKPMTTMRRLDVMSVVKRDTTEQAKRLFINAITVRISSEVVQGVFRAYTPVSSVYVNNSGDLAEWPLPDGMVSPGSFNISQPSGTP